MSGKVCVVAGVGPGTGAALSGTPAARWLAIMSYPS